MADEKHTREMYIINGGNSAFDTIDKSTAPPSEIFSNQFGVQYQAHFHNMSNATFSKSRNVISLCLGFWNFAINDRVAIR